MAKKIIGEKTSLKRKPAKKKAAGKKVVKKKIIPKKPAKGRAIIQKVKLRRVDEIWKRHKPQGLGFSDTDVIILTLKTNDGQIFDQDFYCRLKGDGTLGHSITHASEKRQQNLRNFIGRYFSKDKRYNIRENLNSWAGREVEIEEINGGFSIKI